MSDSASMATSQIADNDRSEIIIAVVCCCLGLSVLMVAVRLYTRIFLVKRVGADDYLAAATMAVLFGQGAAVVINTTFGLGKQKHTLTADLLEMYNMAFYVSVVLYVTCLLLVKATLLTQYFRLFSIQSMDIIYIVTIIAVISWSSIQVILTIFTCIPVSAFWDKNQDRATCLPQTIMSYINAAGNIATEAGILILPLPVLARLNLAKQHRAMLVFIFSLGFLTIAVSGARVKYLNLESDHNYNNANVACLSVAEIACALTCACLLTLRPVISRAMPRRSSMAPLRPPMKSTGYTRCSSRDSHQNTAAMRFLASMESREGLYDDKYMMTADSYEIESRSKKSGSFSEHFPPAKIKRVKSSTELLRRFASVEKKEDAREEDREWDGIFGKKEWSNVSVGFRPSVTTEIVKSPPLVKGSTKPKVPKWEIGVMREVYQTTVYQTTVSKC